MTETKLELNEAKALGWTVASGLFILAVFAGILWLNPPFRYGSGEPRPVLFITGLFMLATLVSLWSLRYALRVKESTHQLWWLIVIFAFLFRGMFLCSNPILEIDYYRYIWDGMVLGEGVSPYLYSPQQVLASTPVGSDEYQTLAALANESPSHHTILSRVHYAEFTTIYPPVSQVVFCLAAKWVAPTAPVEAHIFWMKFSLVLFDVATIWIVGLLLLRLQKHVGWLLLYGWNPLVIKEVANSGHLDSIATFFLTMAIYGLIRVLQSDGKKSPNPWLLGSGTFLGLGIGAKLFPVVLFPAFLISISRRNWRDSVLFLLSFVIVTSACLAPMFLTSPRWQEKLHQRAPLSIESTGESDTELLDASKEGLSSFLSQWRMNDVIFSSIYRNLKPDAPSASSAPWYVFVSNSLRRSVRKWCRDHEIGGDNPAFSLARGATLMLFATIYLLLVRQLRRGEPAEVISTLFFLLASFLFLQPTVNPWYWLWVMPLVCFTRNPGWWLVSMWMFLYYTRFWCKSLTGEYSFLGADFSGVGVFDHGIAWVEFALIVAGVLLGRRWALTHEGPAKG